jgi:radical SAM enzyme (TIGR01210 family)
MKELSEAIRGARQKAPKPKNPKEYVSCWSEKELLDGEVVDSLVMILRTRGCAWALSNGCSMCGYINDATQKQVDEKDIMHQFEKAMEHFSSHKVVKIYTSGSFFDEQEITRALQDKILQILAEKTEKIVVESRPEFITAEILKGKEKLEVALGLESANDEVLKNSINKGFLFKDYKKTAQMLNDLGVGVRTYLLIKPPFLSEKDSIDDAVKSAERISEYTQTISFNPVNIQKFTLIERLWRNNEYRPPWLWSVVEVLKRSCKLNGIRLLSSPTAGGTRKGAHNCGNCDSEILSAIEDFSLSQEVSALRKLSCECKGKWKDTLNIENHAKTHGDLFRLV